MDTVNINELSFLPPIIIPFLIFFARIIDVSLGTLRIILVSRGNRTQATLLGFFEILIWLLAISQIMSNLTSWENYIAYAAGFATGTFVGMSIERRLAIGKLMVRIIIRRDAADLIVYLIAQNYRLTYVDAEGALGPKTVIFTIVKKNHLKDLLKKVREYSPEAFYTVEDVRIARDPDLERAHYFSRNHFLHPFQWFRKGK